MKLEKNFETLHVGGVYLRRDGEIARIVKISERLYPYSTKNHFSYLPSGFYKEWQESEFDLVYYLCEYSDIKRLPEIMAENARLKAEIEQLKAQKP